MRCTMPNKYLIQKDFENTQQDVQNTKEHREAYSSNFRTFQTWVIHLLKYSSSSDLQVTLKYITRYQQLPCHSYN